MPFVGDVEPLSALEAGTPRFASNVIYCQQKQKPCALQWRLVLDDLQIYITPFLLLPL